jgi:DNA-binding MarR family transcriptional regulator
VISTPSGNAWKSLWLKLLCIKLDVKLLSVKLQSAAVTPADRKRANPREHNGAEHPSAELDADLDAQLRLALATWPQIDPDVEGIVTRIARAARYLDNAAQARLRRLGLTKEEFKVVCSLHAGTRSHGSLCRELRVSTGAMTNRLDKLERSGLVTRSRDPNDRRGILLELTPAGHEKLDQYIDTGATRERQLLASLSKSDKRQLNRLLQGLLTSLQLQIGDS